MQLLSEKDILGKRDYEKMRPDFRRRIMRLKSKRRVLLGEHCSVHFECRDTMHYQVQEMLHAENSWERPNAIKEELEAYNPLIPQAGEISATVMFEYETPEERAEHLPKFVGIDRHVWLVIGDAEPVLASFDRGQIDERGVSSVQYVKWTLNEEQRRLLRTEGTPVKLKVDHPAYSAQAVLSEESRREIMNDPD